MEDEDIMPFGKYKGTAMANVPAEYLIWLYDELASSDIIDGNRRDVFGYIEERIEDLQDEILHDKNEDDESEF